MLGFVGALGGSAISAKGSAKAARKNRHFQRDMSNTAYQRAMKDLRAAKLNPLLAGIVGGASTPPGAVAQVPEYGKAIAAGMQADASQTAAKTGKDLAVAQKDNVIANTAKTVKETEQLGWKTAPALFGEDAGTAYKMGRDWIKGGFKNYRAWEKDTGKKRGWQITPPKNREPKSQRSYQDSEAFRKRMRR